MNGIPSILITNDDGVEAEGIHALREALEGVGAVTTVAPRDHMSAASHSISLYRPVNYEQLTPDCYAVVGTPVDSVILALHQILDRPPVLLVSGINQGGNLGHNVYYSGTVAAAVEGTFHAIPSIAISLAALRGSSFGASKRFVRHLAGLVLEHGLPHGVTLNVNVPYGRNHGGARITRRADRHCRRIVLDQSHASEGAGYWIREKLDGDRFHHESDHAAIRDRLISVTPMTFEAGDAASPEEVERWSRSIEPHLNP